MKMRNIIHVEQFLKIVDGCDDIVWLKSKYGDVYNLKSKISQFIAIAALLGYHGNELELLCNNPDDMKKFDEFFQEHPEAVI